MKVLGIALFALGISTATHQEVTDILAIASIKYPEIDFHEISVFPVAFVFLGFIISIASFFMLLGTRKESTNILDACILTLGIFFIQMVVIVVLGNSDAEDILGNVKKAYGKLVENRKNSDFLNALNGLQEEVSL